MKRFTLTLLALLSLALSATAQDTIFMLGPKSNYYDNNYWFVNSRDTGYVQYSLGNIACGYNTSDSVTIYGIAASLFIEEDENTKITELLRLYKRNGDDAEQLGEDLEVFMEDRPTYYMKQDFVRFVRYMTYDTAPVFPVHERYFAEPITVNGLFYVGIYPSVGNFNQVCISCFRPFESTRILNIPCMFYMSSGWRFQSDYFVGTPYLYAILTPPDTTILGNDTIMVGDTVIVSDTIIIGGDTIINYDTILALPEAGLLGRLVGVMPNPAGTTAKVVSSFGLTMVEAFNMAGERLCTLCLPDAPLAATLDVSRWPSGSYLLRIHTPQGVATKKLTVAR